MSLFNKLRGGREKWGNSGDKPLTSCFKVWGEGGEERGKRSSLLITPKRKKDQKKEGEKKEEGGDMGGNLSWFLPILNCL